MVTCSHLYTLCTIHTSCLHVQPSPEHRIFDFQTISCYQIEGTKIHQKWPLLCFSLTVKIDNVCEHPTVLWYLRQKESTWQNSAQKERKQTIYRSLRNKVKIKGEIAIRQWLWKWSHSRILELCYKCIVVLAFIVQQSLVAYISVWQYCCKSSSRREELMTYDLITHHESYYKRSHVHCNLYAIHGHSAHPQTQECDSSYLAAINSQLAR